MVSVKISTVQMLAASDPVVGVDPAATPVDPGSIESRGDNFWDDDFADF